MQLRWLAIVMVSAALLGACGDDDSGSSDAGQDAGENNAGTGSPQGDSAVPPVEIMCKAAKCQAPELNIGALLGDAGAGFLGALPPGTIDMFAGTAPCCAGEDMDKCGVSSAMVTGGACVELDQEGKADKACPALMQTIKNPQLPFEIPLNLAGCCRPDNKCGLDVSLLGTGCVERTEASNFASMTAAMSMVDAAGIDAGAPLEEITCVYEPATEDAGADDAGN